MTEIEMALERARDTKALEFGAGAMEKVPAMFSRLFPGKKAIVVADNNTYRVAGEAVDTYLRNAGIETEQPFIFTDPELFAEWKYIEQLEAYLKERDVIAVAVGSGVINDLTKLVSSHLGRRYIIVGTAASMDGYTAYGASITFEGNKQTFDCPAPLGMVLDPAISAAEPSFPLHVWNISSARILEQWISTRLLPSGLSGMKWSIESVLHSKASQDTLQGVSWRARESTLTGKASARSWKSSRTHGLSSVRKSETRSFRSMRSTTASDARAHLMSLR